MSTDVQPSGWRMSLGGAVTICRPLNSVLGGLLPIVGAYVAGALVVRPLAALVAGIATVLGTAAGNAINDFFDRDIDAVNSPDRPIPSGSISPRGALVVATATASVAVLLTATLLPLSALALGMLNLAVLVGYTPLLKGRIGFGNLAVAYLGGSAFLFGGLAVGSIAGVLVLSALAASATLAREVLKDVEDIAGDTAGGLSTLPAVIGPRNDVLIGDGLLVLTILLSPIPYLTGTLGGAYLAAVIVADGIAVYAIARSSTDVGASQRYVKSAMAVSVIAFLAGRAI